MGSKQAFTAKRTNAFMFDPEDLLIPDDKDHPLYEYTQERLVLSEELVDSIMMFGVIEPIVVKKEGEAAVVVNGRRRVLAAREANKRLSDAGEDLITVYAVSRRGSDDDLFGVSLAANENRLDDSPLQKAEKAARYLARTGQDEKAAAVIFGVDVQTIKNWLALLECAPQVKKAVKKGTLPATAARKLSKLPRKEQVSALNKMEQEVAQAPKSKRSKKAPKITVKRAAKAAGEAPKMRGAREIQAMLKESISIEARKALQWVLGNDWGE